MTTRLLFIGDAHTGMKVGLLKPGMRDEYDKALSLGRAQKLIWSQMQKISEFAKKRKYSLVIMGDPVHGPSEMFPAQLDIADGKGQADAFIEAVLPLASRAQKVYVIDDLSRFHVDAARFTNDYIAQELGAVGRRAYPTLDLFVEGLTIALAHHGPSLGSRPQTRGNPAREYLRDIHIEALADGRMAPDISVFAHWHQFFHESKEVSYPNGHKTIHAYFTPALCAADKLTIRNVRKLVLSDIGAMALDIDGENHVCHRLFMHFDNRVRMIHE